MTTPRLPDSPGSASPQAPSPQAPYAGVPSLADLIPAQRTASPQLHTPAEREMVSPARVTVGRDTRLAVLWTLLGATMGVLLLVAAVLLAPLVRGA